MNSKLFFDSSVLVAALVRNHPHHAQAHAIVNDTVSRGETLYFSAHALAEVYAVLTRIPEPVRVEPTDAWFLIERSLLSHAEVVAIDTQDYRSLVEVCAVENWAGGRVYDMIHIRAAQRCGCTRLYTFNVKHFREMAPTEMQTRIVAP